MSSVASDVCPKEPSHKPWGRRLLQIGLLILFLDLLAVFFWEGFNLRRLAWDYTTPVRVTGEVARNYDLGREALSDGWLNVYENQMAHPRDEARKIDDAPLRLATFEAWATWNRAHLAQADQWQPQYPFNAFVLDFNTAFEFLSALAAFLLVHHWVRRTWRPRHGSYSPSGEAGCASSSSPSGRPRPGPWVGVVRATCAFLLVWFSPAMIISAHGWPSWDSWVIPWFLWAMLLCSWECWFSAGLLLGLGAMFKGQQLFVAPIFILWPLFAGQPGRAFRWAAGFLLGFMAIASGWMLTMRPSAESPLRQWNWPAVGWLTSSLVLVALVALRPRRRALSPARLPELQAAASPSSLRRFVASSLSLLRAPFTLTAQQNPWKHPLTWLAILAALFALPVMLHPVYAGSFSPAARHGALLIAAAILAFAWFARRRRSRYLLAAMLGAGLLLCIPLFGATTAWWDLGFMYGTERHPSMIVGPANNLCAILETFGWRDIHEIVYTIPARALLGFPKVYYDLEMVVLMFSLYILFLLGAAVALALQWRRNDRNFLIALATPWVLFYTIPAQIHERYLLFAAGAAACAIGCNIGMMLLDVLFILLAALQAAQSMMRTNHIGTGYDLAHPLFNAETARWCQQITPDISYALVLACIIFFYVSFTRYRRVVKTPEAKVKRAA